MPEPIDSVIEEWTARLDEAERLAKLTDRPEWDSNFEGAVWDSDGWIADVGGDMNAHIALHDPSSVLEDIGRKRRIIADYRVAAEHYASISPEAEASLNELFTVGMLQAFERAIRTLAGATEETT